MGESPEVRSDAQDVIVSSRSEDSKRVLWPMPAELDDRINVGQKDMVDDGVLGIGMGQRLPNGQRTARLAAEREGDGRTSLHGALLVEPQAAIEVRDGVLARADKRPVESLLRD